MEVPMDVDSPQPLEASEPLDAGPPVASGPLHERIVNKDWKVRSAAVEEMKNAMSTEGMEAEAWTTFGRLLPGITGDSNANVMDAALDAAYTFFDLAPTENADDCALQVVGNVIEKAFGGRPSAQSKGKRLVLKVMEVSDLAGTASALLAKLSDRRPKIPPACIELLTEGLVSFGVGGFPVKSVIKELLAVFNGNNSQARDAAMKLLLEIHRWIGQAPLQQLLDGLRSAQKSEFEKLLAEREATPGEPAVPTVSTRKDRAAMASGSAATSNQKSSVDARAFCEEIDLAKALKGGDFSEQIASDKWSDQHAALQQLLKVMGPTPVLKYSSTVHDLVGICHGFLKQGHVQVQTTSLRALHGFAEGLHDKVSSDLRPLIPTLVQRFKEKKLVADLVLTIKSILRHSIGFDHFASEIVEVLRGKNPPHAKIGLAELFQFVVQEMLACNPENLGAIFEALQLCCEDPDAKVREASLKALSAVVHAAKTGSKRMESLKSAIRALEVSSSKLFNRIVATDQETGAAPDGGEGSKALAPSAQPKAESKALPAKPAAAPRPKAAPATQQNPRKAPAASSGAAAEDEAVEEGAMGPEQAMEILQTFLGDKFDSFVAKFASAKWQEKLESMTEFQELISDGFKAGDGMLFCALTTYVSKNTAGFKISNIMVMKGVVDLCAKLASVSSTDRFAKSAAWELLQQFADKLSDKKVGTSVETLISVLCDQLGGNIILKRVSVLVEASKAPATHQSFLQLLKNRIESVGIGQIPVMVIAQFCIREIEHKMAGVRANAVEALGAMYGKCGPRLFSVIKMDDLPQQTRQLLDAEFTKVGYDPTTAQPAGAEQGDIFPRKDLLQLLDKNIVKELNFTEGKNSWQNRKKALENIVTACESSGHYLEFNKPTVEIIKAAKARINDTQSNLKPIAMNALGHMVASFPTEGGQKVLRLISGGMLAGLADNKRPMREATIASLQLAVNKGGQVTEPELFMSVVPSLGEAFANAIGRQELLEWLLLHKGDFSGDQSELIQPLLSALMDKLAPVRTLSEQLLTYFIANSLITKAAIDKVARDMTPANKRAIQAVLDRLNGLSVEKASASEPAGHPAVTTAAVEPTAQSPERHVLTPPSPNRVAVAADDKWKEIAWPQPPQEPSYNELLVLKAHWSSLLELPLAECLFPSISRFDLFSQDVLLPGIGAVAELLSGAHPGPHLPYMLAWMGYAFHVKESVTGMRALLDLMVKVLQSARALGRDAFDERALRFLLPHLIDGYGNLYERHGEQLSGVLSVVRSCVSHETMVPMLLAGLSSTNKRSRLLCIEELDRIVQRGGASVVRGSQDFPRIAALHEVFQSDALLAKPISELMQHLSSSDNAVRTEEPLQIQPELTSGKARTITAPEVPLHATKKANPSGETPARDLPTAASALATWVASCNSSNDDGNAELRLANMRLVVIEQLRLAASNLQMASQMSLPLLCDCIQKVIQGAGSSGQLDFSLLAVALAVQHRLAKAAKSLTVEDLKAVVLSCLRCSEALLNSDLKRLCEEDIKAGLLRALHMIVVDVCRLGSVSQLLRILFDAACEGGSRSSAADQAICRLADNASGLCPLQRGDTEGSRQLLTHLHVTTSMSPVTSPSALHVLRKTIAYMMSELGEKFVREALATIAAPADAVVSVVLDRLATSSESRGDAMHAKIVALIDQITSSSNKTEPIVELFQIKQQHGATIDIDVYLSKLSVHFRSYVLESWQAMERATSSPSKQSMQMHDKSPSVRRPLGEQQRGNSSSAEGATEAMRILEGLKSRPNNYTRVTKPVAQPSTTAEDEVASSPRPQSISRGAASPFARRNDKIRDSLSTLSASLDLPTTLRENRPNATSSDLQERLQRLKSNMEL